MESFEVKRQRLLLAKTTVWLGGLSLVPFAGIAAAALSAIAGALAFFLAKRKPSRYGGIPLIYLGLGMSLAGTLLFFFEARAFLVWKIDQAYEQRAAVSKARMTEWSAAFENYRLDNGMYPESLGIIHVRDLLVPLYAPSLSLEDGWDNLFQLEVNPCGYTISCAEPPKRSGEKGARLTSKAIFPLPPPPAPPPVGPPAPWPPPFDQQAALYPK